MLCPVACGPTIIVTSPKRISALSIGPILATLIRSVMLNLISRCSTHAMQNWGGPGWLDNQRIILRCTFGDFGLSISAHYIRCPI